MILNVSMTQKDKQIELHNKIIKGMETVFERLLEFKKTKNSELVIMKGDKIVRVKPEDMPQPSGK